MLPFLDFQQRFNAITLSLPGITQAMEISADGGRRSLPIPAAAFAAGIDLAELWFSAPVQQASDALRYTTDKDRIYYNGWRVVALRGANGPFHHPRAHAAAITYSERLDRCRLIAGAQTFTVDLAPADTRALPVANGEFITDWRMMGTLPKPWTTDALGGEAAFTAAARPLGPGWFSCVVDAAKLPDCLNRCFGPSQDCFAYALAVLDSPREQSAELLVGSDDGYALWLNGQTLATRLDLARGCQPDQERIPVTLRHGRNVLLMKITQGGGQWGFCLRFAGLAHDLLLMPVLSESLSSSSASSSASSSPSSSSDSSLKAAP